MPVYPYLTVRNVRMALPVYEQAFGAEVFHRVASADDPERIVHARFRLAGSVVMVTEHTPDQATGVVLADEIGGSTVTIRVESQETGYVERIFAEASAAGCAVVAAPAPMPWGEFYGRLKDPFGHVWAFGEPLSPLREGGRGTN